jgi:hypothetical protein
MTALLMAGAGCLIGPPVALADPLIPPTPGEIQFVEQARRILPGTGDPIAFNSNGELLGRGRQACLKRDSYNAIGQDVTYVSPIITQLAFVYLCPQ